MAAHSKEAGRHAEVAMDLSQHSESQRSELEQQLRDREQPTILGLPPPPLTSNDQTT